MKTQIPILTLFSLFSISLIAQQNNTLRGKMLFLSSDKQPAVGVAISGSVQVAGGEKATKDYTQNDGFYELIFPENRDGHRVQISVGDSDAKGGSIELVNVKEVEQCRIPAKATDRFEIIVCRKGARDLVAQRYYNIIRTSSDIALAKTKKRLDGLLDQQEKDYQQITALSGRIEKLQEQTDSLSIYKEAYRIASINKDRASERVLRYIQLLDEGKPIQEARKVLSIKGAAKDLEESISLFDAAIEELETRASASRSIFDYEDAIASYDTIIVYAEKMGVNDLKLASYYGVIGNIYKEHGQYQQALSFKKRNIEIVQLLSNDKNITLANSLNSIGIIYNALGKHEEALKSEQQALKIMHDALQDNDPDLANFHANLGVTYNYLEKYDSAFYHIQRSIDIQRAEYGDESLKLANSYNHLSGVYRSLSDYGMALFYQKECLIIREALRANDLILANSYNNISVIYADLAQYRKSLKYQEKSVRMRERVLSVNHPVLANSYNNISGLYKAFGDYDNALKSQEKAVNILEKTLPKNHYLQQPIYKLYWDIYYARGQQRFLNKNYNGALEDFKIAARHVNNSNVLVYIGMCYYNLKLYSEAIKAYKRAKSINPNINPTDYYNNIGTSYVKNHQFNKAKLAFKEYQKSYPNGGRIYRNWAMYHALQGQKQQALKQLEKAIDLGYDDIDWLQKDDSMDSLRGTKTFKSLLKQVAK